MVKTDCTRDAELLEEALGSHMFQNNSIDSSLSPNNLDDLEIENNFENDFEYGFSNLVDSLEDIVESEKNKKESISVPVNIEEEYSVEECLTEETEQNSISSEEFVDTFNKCDNTPEELTEDLIESQLNQLFTDDLEMDNNSKENNQDLMDDQEDPDNVELVTVNDSFEEFAEVVYPCLIINGATSQEEVNFLKRFQVRKENSKAIFLYCEAPQGIIEIGHVELSLQFLLTLSRMPGYKLFSVFSEKSTKQEINLTNPEVLINFISF